MKSTNITDNMKMKLNVVCTACKTPLEMSCERMKGGACRIRTMLRVLGSFETMPDLRASISDVDALSL